MPPKAEGPGGLNEKNKTKGGSVHIVRAEVIQAAKPFDVQVGRSKEKKKAEQKKIDEENIRETKKELEGLPLVGDAYLYGRYVQKTDLEFDKKTQDEVTKRIVSVKSFDDLFDILDEYPIFLTRDRIFPAKDLKKQIGEFIKAAELPTREIFFQEIPDVYGLREAVLRLQTEAEEKGKQKPVSEKKKSRGGLLGLFFK